MDLAYLADKPITPEAVLRWANNYGLLGLPEDDIVAVSDEFIFRASGIGRRDNVARFAEAAGEVRTCLRAYEAATAGEGPLDLEGLRASTGPLPMKALRPWERREGEERAWLFGVIARVVQMRLYEHCFPQLSTFNRGRKPSGRFGLGYGFKNLLGAIWLQMAWLLSSDNLTRCKLPDCRRIITFEPSEPPADTKFKDGDGRYKKNIRGKYKTRADKVFCDHRCAANYSYRKKAGWPGYI